MATSSTHMWCVLSIHPYGLAFCVWMVCAADGRHRGTCAITARSCKDINHNHFWLCLGNGWLVWINGGWGEVRRVYMVKWLGDVGVIAVLAFLDDMILNCVPATHHNHYKHHHQCAVYVLFSVSGVYCRCVFIRLYFGEQVEFESKWVLPYPYCGSPHQVHSLRTLENIRLPITQWWIWRGGEPSQCWLGVWVIAFWGYCRTAFNFTFCLCFI